jgi:hypothetical protein
MRDAYERFFESLKIAPEQFFQFGLSEIIHVPIDAAYVEWEQLKLRISNGDPVFIRGFGRNASNSDLFTDLYGSLFGHRNILVDPTNNAAPAKLLQVLTGFSKTPKRGCERVRNYQVTHVFGRTKNPYAFTAPWNIVYLPKIIDPFTGHESTGDLTLKFQHMFREHILGLFSPMIQDFNQIVCNQQMNSRIEAYLAILDKPPALVKKIRNSLNEEWKPIA